MKHPIPRLSTPDLTFRLPEKDPRTQTRSGFTYEELEAFINDQACEMQAATVVPTHEQVLNNLLDQVVKIDFRERVSSESANDQDKLKKQHYLICVVEEVLHLATQNRWGLSHRDNSFYI